MAALLVDLAQLLFQFRDQLLDARSGQASVACRASERYFMIFIASSTRSFLWAMKRASRL